MSRVSREDIDALVQLFESSSWDELELTLDGVELHLSKNHRQVPHPPSQVENLSGQGTREAVQEPAAVATAAADNPRVQVGAPPGMLEIRAPHLGTFYRAPKPGSPPFIEVGQKVNAETEVCLLEVMKLFTTLRAGLAGIVRKICVTDSALVESGQTLFLVEPES